MRGALSTGLPFIFLPAGREQRARVAVDLSAASLVDLADMLGCD